MSIHLPAGPGLSAPVVLLADANDDTRLMYAEYLRSLQYSIDEAVDGRTALARAIAGRPGIVVSDTRPPGISGLELCRLLRLDEATKHTPIIMVSADALPREIAVAEAAGADLVLVKPCLPEQLAAAITELLIASGELRARSGELRARAGATRTHSDALAERSAAGLRRLRLKDAVDRRRTSEPPAAPPALRCPRCDRPLRYLASHLGGVSIRYQEQWDRFECAACGGTFEYRHRTRKLRLSQAGQV